jgi:hypothetical protein
VPIPKPACSSQRPRSRKNGIDLETQGERRLRVLPGPAPTVRGRQRFASVSLESDLIITGGDESKGEGAPKVGLTGGGGSKAGSEPGVYSVIELLD